MNTRGIVFGDASGTAGNDDAADAGEPVRRSIDGKEVTLNADLTNTTREQMTVLTTRIKNRNAFHDRDYTGLPTAGCRPRLLLTQECFHPRLRLGRHALLRDGLDGEVSDFARPTTRNLSNQLFGGRDPFTSAA